MNDPAIVNRYAAAFLKEAKDRHLVQRLYTETQVLSELLLAQPRIIGVLGSPHIPLPRKTSLIERVFKGHLTPLLCQLIQLMVQKRRAGLLEAVLGEFRRMVDHERGIYEATITTARELSFLDKLQLKTSLERFTGHKLNLEFRVEPDLIGGVIFQYQDLYIDDSVRGQLARLRQSLQAADVIK